MTPADDVHMDRDLRDLWADSKPLGGNGHLDETNWRAFLEGTLDSANRDTARAHIASCPDCAAVFKSAHTAALSHVAQEASRPSRAVRQLPYLATAGAFGIVLAALFLRRPMDAPSATSVIVAPTTASAPVAPLRAQPRLEKAPVVIGAEQLLATRGSKGDTAFVKDLSFALEPYERDDFAEAAVRLGRLSKARPGSFEASFYAGVSLFLDGRPAEAVTTLEHAEKLASPARQAEAGRWLSAARAATAQPQ